MPVRFDVTRSRSSLMYSSAYRVGSSTDRVDLDTARSDYITQWACSLLVLLVLHSPLLSGQDVPNSFKAQGSVQSITTETDALERTKIRYVSPSWAWSYTDRAGSIGDLSAAGSNTLTLPACPAGIDTGAYNGTVTTAGTAVNWVSGTQFTGLSSGNTVYINGWVYTIGGSVTPTSLKLTASAGNQTDVRYLANHFYPYRVYISGTGTPEAADVNGGSCPSGTANGTIKVTTAYRHPAGFKVGSASGGIQEAWNDAWVGDDNNNPMSASVPAPYVKLLADTEYEIYSAPYLRGRGGVFDAAGALINCHTRDRCIYVGTTQAYPKVHHHKLYNLTGTSAINVDGVQVSSVSAASGLYTITTASSHPFVAGDVVDCEYHSQTSEQHWVNTVLSSGLTSSQFQVFFGRRTFEAGSTTFGFCNILNAFIEDNSDHLVLQDVNIMQTTGNMFFSYGIVDDNDQAMVIERTSNRSSWAIKTTGNWPIGAYIYQRTDQGMAGIVYLHASELSGVNCFSGGGNGLVVTDSVCQGFPVFGFRYNGGFQPSTIQNVYEESSGTSNNPLYGTSGAVNGAAQMGYLLKGGPGHRIVGTFPGSGFAPRFNCSAPGTGGTRNYFVVPRASAIGSGYGPVLYIGHSAGCDSGNINLYWPSVGLQDASGSSVGRLSWDVLMTLGTGTNFGSAAIYALATGISSNCSTNGMCTYKDTQLATPTAYTVQPQVYAPSFWFWPLTYVIQRSVVLMDQTPVVPSAVSAYGTLGTAIIANQCSTAGTGIEQRSPIWVSCPNSDWGPAAGMFAELLQQRDTAGGGPPVGSKGRLNFGPAITAPNDLITLQDANVTKTLATAGERPSGDAGDIAIGLDQSGGMAVRAPVSISQYLNVVPNKSPFQTRLDATGFAVNTNFNSFRNPVAKTANFTILASQSGGFFDNTGAVREVDFTLPSCDHDGLHYTFYVDNPQIEKVIATDKAKIRLGSQLGTTNGNIRASATGDSLSLQCVGTSGADSIPEWVTTSSMGTWTVN